MKAYVTHRILSSVFVLLVFIGVVVSGVSEAVIRIIADNPTGGDCVSIGIWDAKRKTCTLSTDLTDPVEIVSSGITLTGNGHVILGLPGEEVYAPGCGLTLSGVAGVTVTHLTIENFEVGIYLNSVTSAHIAHNSLPNNYVGIQLDLGGQNEITANDLYEVGYGILLNTSEHNAVIGNINQGGCCQGVILMGPEDYSGHNRIAGNELLLKGHAGLRVGSGYNTLTGNIVAECALGISITLNGDYNTISYNTLINNYEEGQAHVSGVGNMFRDNYWSDHAAVCNDADMNGSCDEPYIFFGGEDESARVADTIEAATVVFAQDPIRTKSSAKTASAYIEIPGHVPGDIVVESIRLIAERGYIWVYEIPVATGDYDMDGIPDLMVRFSREDLFGVLNPGPNELTVVGVVGDVTFESTLVLNVQ